jgi:hypothetical protein
VNIESRKTPLSLFCLTIAESGARKSTVDKMALAPHSRYQRELRQNYKIEKENYQIELEAYNSIKKTVTSQKKVSQDEMARELKKLNKPEKPVEPLFICQEPTLEGLQKSYENGLPSQGFFNDEGAQVFGGNAMNADNAAKTAAGLSRFWDGSTIIRTRAGEGESLYLNNRRLASHLMIQPIISNKIFKNEILMQQGILGRYLVAHPKSLAGTRFIVIEKESAEREKNKEAIDSYNILITELLNKPYKTNEDGGLNFDSIILEDGSYELWVNVFNGIEMELTEQGKYPHLKPTAQKMGENILRIAGLFSIVDSTPKITIDQMERACKLGLYYLEQFHIAITKTEIESEINTANTLLTWLKNKDYSIINIDDFNNAPRSIGARNRKKARALMHILTKHNYTILIEKNKNGEGSSWKLIN